MGKLGRIAGLFVWLVAAGWCGEFQQHRIEAGQTLAAIARQYGVPLAALLEANPGIDPHHLAIGQQVQVPLTATTTEQVAPSEVDPSAAPATEPGQPQPQPPAGLWESVTMADGRRGWVPREALWLPSPQPLPPEGVLQVASRFRGAPYRWGGASPNGVDCSGFVQEVFRLAGHGLPRLADEQFLACQPVDDPQPGDLVFFSTYLPGPSHVGIYLGEGRFLHASSSRGVVEELLDSAYFKSRFLGARRWSVPAPSAAVPR